MRLLRTLVVILFSFHTVITFGQEGELLSPEEQLIIAADDGDSTQVAVLIRQGANVNTETFEGVTPLMFASQKGYSDIVQLLVNSGAELNSDAYDGNTALTMAIQNGYFDIAAFLLEKGASANASDMDSTTALMQAIAIDSFYLPDMLIYYGADIHKKDRNGKNALMYAAESGRFEVVFRLLEEGANINSTDKRGNTPLHYSAFKGQNEVIELLLVNNALVDEKNLNGYTPLALAVSENHYEAAKSLIAYGADVNTRISRSQNLLSLTNGNDSIRTLLEVNGAERLNAISFNQFSLGPGYLFNEEDKFLFFNFGLTENRYHLMPGFSYGLRPEAIRIIKEVDQGTYYQYWERRHYLSFSLDKGFFWKNHASKGMNSSAYLGLGGVFTFGSYRGADAKPKSSLVLAPRAGCMIAFNVLRINIYYQFTNFHLKNYNNHWAGISLEFLFRKKQVSRIIR